MESNILARAIFDQPPLVKGGWTALNSTNAVVTLERFGPQNQPDRSHWTLPPADTEWMRCGTYALACLPVKMQTLWNWLFENMHIFNKRMHCSQSATKRWRGATLPWQDIVIWQHGVKRSLITLIADWVTVLVDSAFKVISGGLLHLISYIKTTWAPHEEHL